MIKKILFLLLAVVIPFLEAFAESKPDLANKGLEEGIYIPEGLSPWVIWVKENNPDWNCARNNNSYECTWPGTLTYILRQSGADFTLSVEMLKKGLIPLPSSAALYPREVTVLNQKGEVLTAALSLNAGLLWVKLPVGQFQIKGSFVWNSLPLELPIPNSYGLADITLPQELNDLKARRGSQSLRLEKREESRDTESLTLTVMRKIVDGSPLTIDTLLRIKVSGRSRSLQIPALLPAGAQAVTLQSPLPAQLTAEGTLALQLLPGEYDIHILALMQQPVTSISAPEVSLEAWPKEEVWSWQSDMNLRSVELAGGQPLNADITQLPSDWKQGAVYVMSAAASLKLNETRRGEQSLAANNISLNREIWLDLDGSGSTVLDNFSGILNQDFRINALPSLQVGRATVNGSPALVTLDPKNQTPGVEFRSQALNMEAVSRLSDSRSIDATGWNVAVDKLGMRINIPPSWELLYVAGATKVIGSWVDSWTLLQVFISILLVLGSYKLFGKIVAIVLSISMLLNHAEFLAPQMLFIHLLLLTSWRMLTDSQGSIWRTLSQSLLVMTFCTWALQSLAFAKLQFTETLFPQLEAGTRHRTILQELVLSLEGSLLVWPILLVCLALIILAIRSVMRATSVMKIIFRVFIYSIGLVVLISLVNSFFEATEYSRVESTQITQSGAGSFEHYSLDSTLPMEKGFAGDVAESKSPLRSLGKSKKGEDFRSTFSYQGKNLLSGPALPAWRWHSFDIAISSPVNPGHKINFYLLSPEVSRLLSAIRTALSMILVILVFKALGFSIEKMKSLVGDSKQAVTSILIFFTICLSHPTLSFGQNPNQDLLNELQSKLEKRLCSQTECTLIESAKFSISESTFKLTLEVLSDGISSVKIPGPIEVLSPEKIKLNSHPAIAMRRNESGFLILKTNAGKNIIEMEGKLPDPQAFSVQFSQKALYSSIDASLWFVEGLSASGLVQDNLRFIRQSSKEDPKQQVQSGIKDLNSWVQVQRNISIGDQISLHTTVERLGSFDKEAHIQFALIPNEQVTSGSVIVQNSEVVLSFSPGVQQQSFSSLLPFSSELKLVAKPQARVAEQWVLSCQPFISCEFSGLQPTASTLNSARAFLWLPFPSEEVAVYISVLAGLKGDFITVDQLRHDIRWGANIQEGSLTASVRATQQTTFKFSAPADSEIRAVTLNGQSGQSTESGSESSVILSPGTHSVNLSYSKPWIPQFKEQAPAAAVNASVSNFTVTISPSADRWILWTGGMAWGPCVVFWAKMIIVICLCIFLLKLSLIPGSIVSTIFLGVGLTTLPLWLIIVPLTWLASLVLLPKIGMKFLFVPRWLRMSGFLSLSILAVLVWYGIVKTGLVLAPPMLIAGNGSTASSLNWYVDHVSSALPTPYIISLPIWSYRVLALIWSTWLVLALFSWLRSCVEIARSEFIVGTK